MLALGGFFPLLDGGAVRAVALIVRSWNKACFADLAFLLFHRLHDLGEQLPVCWKDCVFEIIAVDSIPADALHASVFLAVVQQKAVTVHIITAEFFNEGVDPL